MRDSDLNPFPEPLDNAMPRGIEYLEFLERELIPFVESNYRVKPNDRTLWGYSYGGYFTLYVMFQISKLFQRYIFVDGFDPKYLDIEEAYASQHTDLPTQLCFLAPSGDMGKDETEFFNTLKGRNYPNFKSEYIELKRLVILPFLQKASQKVWFLSFENKSQPQQYNHLHRSKHQRRNHASI